MRSLLIGVVSVVVLAGCGNLEATAPTTLEEGATPSQDQGSTVASSSPIARPEDVCRPQKIADYRDQPAWPSPEAAIASVRDAENYIRLENSDQLWRYGIFREDELVEVVELVHEPSSNEWTVSAVETCLTNE